MTTICTSCGKFIPPSQIVYKCRQCVNHFVCQLCETKPHNRASTAFHTLDKTLVSDVQPTITTAGDASSKSASDPRPNPTQVSLITATSNIFLILFMFIINGRRLQSRHQYLIVTNISTVYWVIVLIASVWSFLIKNKVFNVNNVQTISRFVLNVCL
jgi:hypothetical protein